MKKVNSIIRNFTHIKKKEVKQMANINENIRCDVCSCAYNCEGKNCTLNQVKITTDCTDCTCCDSYSFKGEN